MTRPKSTDYCDACGRPNASLVGDFYLCGDCLERGMQDVLENQLNQLNYDD